MPISFSGLIGIQNLANQRHKIVSRQGTNFTVMVVGESGVGKTTFVNTLFSTLLKEYKPTHERHSSQMDRQYVEEKGFRVRLTVVDTPGFGDYVNNSECWVPIIDFIDEQHNNYMKAESSGARKGIDDLRVHACMYFIQPTGHTYVSLFVCLLLSVDSSVKLTLSPTDGSDGLAQIRDCLETHGINYYTPPIDDDDQEAAVMTQSIVSAMPFSVIASENEVNVNGQMVRGREYLWGVAEVENEAHCDFKKLRNLLIRTHMHDLIQSTQEEHYETFRTGKLTSMGRSDDDPVVRAKKVLASKMKEDEEALRKRFTEQVRQEENRFRQWEQRLIAERDRLNKDLEDTHRMVKELEHEFEEAQGGR
ncbi:Septin-domain-containing protein [Entophlyctis helioformis]|nr:Septin-domain-containing protein [Entophlyctis helioformis]